MPLVRREDEADEYFGTKQRILDEIVATTSFHRKYATAVLNHRSSPQPKPRRRSRDAKYGDEVREALVAGWVTFVNTVDDHSLALVQLACELNVRHPVRLRVPDMILEEVENQLPARIADPAREATPLDLLPGSRARALSPPRSALAVVSAINGEYGTALPLPNVATVAASDPHICQLRR